MKKSRFISILALLVAAVGVVIAFLAYFSKRKCVLCDDFDEFDDDLMAEEPGDIEYYAAEMESVDPDGEDIDAPHAEESAASSEAGSEDDED